MPANKKIKMPVFLGLACAITSVFFYSCKKEIIITKKPLPEVVIEAGDARLLAGDIHFVKDTVYVLAANLVRNTGQTFTLDAGTLVKVKNNIGITINSGGKIFANGTQTDPVVFTSAANKGGVGKVVASGSDGLNFWYGISITGSTGVSSGNMNFVRIEFAGGYRGIQGEASLSLNMVDKLTSLENIQVSYSFEIPSFDFSGGNCNAAKLVSYASFLSDFVIENGYNGMLQNLLAYRLPYFAPSCDRGCDGLELSGLTITGANTFPAISNLTILGPDLQNGTSKKYFDTTFVFGSTGRVAALIIKSGKFFIRNSVVAGFAKTGILLDNRTTGTALNNNEIEFTYSAVETNDASRAFYLTPGVYRPFTSADLKSFLLRPQYHNQQFLKFDDLGFTDPFSYDVKPDPLPKTGSPLLSGANFSGADIFFKRVDYIGAIGTENWMQGWINFLPLQTDYNN